MLPNCYMTPKILVKDPKSTLIERSVEFLEFQAKEETKQYTPIAFTITAFDLTNSQLPYDHRFYLAL